MAADETAYEELLTMDQPKVNRVGRRILANLTYNEKKLECQLDTAAARNILSYQDYISLGEPTMQNSAVILTLYDDLMGHPQPITGSRS